MNKVLPIIMVVSFWGIYVWGMSNPKVGEAIIAITLAGIFLFVIRIFKKVLWLFISRSDSKISSK